MSGRAGVAGSRRRCRYHRLAAGRPARLVAPARRRPSSLVASVLIVVGAAGRRCCRSRSWLRRSTRRADVARRLTAAARPRATRRRRAWPTSTSRSRSLIPVTWFVDPRRARACGRGGWPRSRPRIRWRFLVACLGLVGRRADRARSSSASLLPGRRPGDVSGHAQRLHHDRRATSLLVVAAAHPAAGRGGGVRSSAATSPRPSAALFRAAVGRRSLVAGAAVRARPRRARASRSSSTGSRSAWSPASLVIRTGGLEAGIAMHVLNNFLAFGLALAYGDMAPTLNPTGGSWWSIPVTAHPVAGLPRPGARSWPAGWACDRPPTDAARRFGGAREPRVRFPGGRPERSVARPRLPGSQGRQPLGYGVIGSTTGSGPVSLGSSPSTPARSAAPTVAIWIRLDGLR